MERNVIHVFAMGAAAVIADINASATENFGSPARGISPAAPTTDSWDPGGMLLHAAAWQETCISMVIIGSRELFPAHVARVNRSHYISTDLTDEDRVPNLYLCSLPSDWDLDDIQACRNQNHEICRITTYGTVSR